MEVIAGGEAFSKVLQPVRGLVSSPALTSSGMAHPFLLYQGQFHCIAQARYRDHFPVCYRRQGGRASSDGPMTSGPVLQTAAVGRRKWGALAPHPGHFTASRQVGGPALPSSHPWSWLTCIPSTSTIWTLWLGEALALLFLSVACCHRGERWNKLS